MQSSCNILLWLLICGLLRGSVGSRAMLLALATLKLTLLVLLNHLSYFLHEQILINIEA